MCAGTALQQMRGEWRVGILRDDEESNEENMTIVVRRGAREVARRVMKEDMLGEILAGFRKKRRHPLMQSLRQFSLGLSASPAADSCSFLMLKGFLCGSARACLPIVSFKKRAPACFER